MRAENEILSDLTLTGTMHVQFNSLSDDAESLKLISVVVFLLGVKLQVITECDPRGHGDNRRG